MKEFIIADADRNDIAPLGENCSIDIDVGNTNDFQLVIPMSEYNPEIHKAGNIVYCIGTELGGVLNDPIVNTGENTITFTGDTPRGMLNKKIIEPPSGSDYRTTGNTPYGTLMTTMLYNYSFESLIKAVINTTTSVVYNRQYDRYCKLLDGVLKILAEGNYKVEIKAEYDSEGKIVWNVYTVDIVNYTDQIEISQDCDVNFKIKQKTNLYTHMICAGKGELQERKIIHLYLQADGSIGTSQFYTDAEDKVYFYDYSSAEDDNELKKSGIAKFAEINATDTQEITFDNLDVFPVGIGDIVGGRDYHTGLAISQKVSNIIYKYQYGEESTEVKVGE